MSKKLPVKGVSQRRKWLSKPKKKKRHREVREEKDEVLI